MTLRLLPITANVMAVPYALPNRRARPG